MWQPSSDADMMRASAHVLKKMIWIQFRIPLLLMCCSSLPHITPGAQTLLLGAVCTLCSGHPVVRLTIFFLWAKRASLPSSVSPFLSILSPQLCCKVVFIIFFRVTFICPGEGSAEHARSIPALPFFVLIPVKWKFLYCWPVSSCSAPHTRVRLK